MSRTNLWFKDLGAVLLVFIGIIFLLNNFNPNANLIELLMPIIFITIGAFILLEHYSNHRISTNWLSTFFGYFLCFIGVYQITERVFANNLINYRSLFYLVIIALSLLLTWFYYRKTIILFFTFLVSIVFILNLLTQLGFWKLMLPIILVIMGSYLFIKIPHKE
jgi:hypothetical protein